MDIDRFIGLHAKKFQTEYAIGSVALKEIIKEVIEDLQMIPRQTIVEKLVEHKEAMEQWLENTDLEEAVDYKIKMEALMELLETFDCGSVGGFDKNQTDRTFEGRYKWLINKRSLTLGTKDSI